MRDFKSLGASCFRSCSLRAPNDLGDPEDGKLPSIAPGWGAKTKALRITSIYIYLTTYIIGYACTYIGHTCTYIGHTCKF